MMEATPSRPRRSGRLASATPSQPETTAHALPKRAQKTKAAAAFDPRTVITRISRGDRAVLTGLTKVQLQDVIHAYADRDAEKDERITTLEYQVQRADAARRHATMGRMKSAEIVRRHQEKKAAQAKAEAATQTADLPPSPSPPQAEGAQTTTTAISPRPVTPPEAIIPSPAAAASGWIWGSFSRIFGGSFTSSKKRRAEDEPATDEPVQKRQKPAQQEQAPAEQPPRKRQRPTEPAPTATEQPTAFTSSSTTAEQRTARASSSTSKQTPHRPAPAATEPPATAPPRSVTFDQSTKTPARTPKRKRTTATAAVATPLPAIAEASTKEMYTITPRPRRTLASTRAAQSERKAPAQPPRRYAWEDKPDAPRQPNADARIAKIRHVASLRRQLKQYEEDPDVRPTKRAKIDNLVSIPHNLPGDSSGTFRFPEVDSDDEMEVYDNVEERPNIFSASQQLPETPLPAAQQATPYTQQATKPLPQPPQLPAQQSVTTLLHPSSAPATTTTTTTTTEQHTSPMFDFPSVKPKPADYYVTKEYQEDAGRIFAEGFANFLASSV